IIGMGTAIDYLNEIGIDSIATYEKDLFEYAERKLSTVEKLTPIGTAANKLSVFSFTLEGIHPHDIGTILDFEGIAIRTGHHCTQPVMQRFGIPATARISLSFYNTKEEIDFTADAVKKVFEVFG
ncbi:MAG: aminotransferase class V-fold PLP-dependent enzyme, partial [Ignavibacteria bacterium]|nr:aminotransferase class V-fold PLP-dependent enzyme [Ignavibacteria bacterium]